MEELMTPRTTMSLGKQLNHWRQEKGWTIGQLAVRSGVSKASLSRWEAELTQPRVRELEAVLDALALSEVMRVTAFSHIGSVRAVKRVVSSPSKIAVQRTPENPLCGELPRTGALLRALRSRIGHTQWEVASLLGIQQSSITRWESSAESPTMEHLQRLCCLLNATPAEIEALSRGPFIPPTSEELRDLSEMEWRKDNLVKNAVFGTWGNADLDFFQLEADLWPSAQKNVNSLNLLMEVYAAHARYLVWRQRHAEAKRYLNLLRGEDGISNRSQNRLSVPAQTGLLLEVDPLIQSGHRSVQTALQRLIKHQAQITDPEHRAWLFMTLAEGYAILGRTEDACHYCGKGIATPLPDGRDRSEDPATLLFRATVFNHIGRPECALIDMDSLSGHDLTPAQHTKAAVVRATGYAALGDTAAASDMVRSGYALIESYRTVSYKASLDSIALMQ